MSGIDPYQPEVAARNHRLGLILAGVVALVILAFILRFSFAGLPEDYKEWSRLQQRQSQQDPEQVNDNSSEPSPATEVQP